MASQLCAFLALEDERNGLLVVSRVRPQGLLPAIQQLLSHSDIATTTLLTDQFSFCNTTLSSMMQCESRGIIQSIPPRTTRVGP
jgi:hypothetical protein